MRMISLLLAAAAAPSVRADGEGLPATPEEFSKRYHLGKVVHATVGPVDLWVEDEKLAEAVKAPLQKAVQHAEKLVGADLLGGERVRVVVVKKNETLAPYLRDFAAEARRVGSAGPDAAYAGSAADAGSCWWGHPALVLLSGQTLQREARDTRLVHNLGHVLGGQLVSATGVGPPSLVEGLSGELVRASIAKPDAVVCGEGAALKEKTHGYGVFGTIDVVANDSTNDVSVWPRMLKQVVRSLRKPPAANGEKADGEGYLKVKVAALVGRRPSEFRRADYAFSWSVLRFLLDPEPAKPAAGATPPAAGKGRRERVLAAFREMRKDYDAAATREEKIDLYRERLLRALEMSPDELHAAWLDWAEKTYART